jgi:predicted DNA-binding transcriptional regulator YafY
LLASEGLDIASLTKRVRAVHAGKRRLGLKCFQALAQATLERKKVHVHHFNRQRGETTERDISPQQLVHYRDNWYVDAWCHLRNKLLNFSVDAIMECDILPEAAKELSQKDIRIVMQSGYGIFGGEAHNWAKLKFSAVRARWVQAEEWHPEQKGTPSEDGSYTLEFPYSDERELLGDILRFGADVEVLGPKSLRQSVQRAVEQLAKMYALDSP